MILELYKVNDNANVVTIGAHKFYFSYSTCVAYSNAALSIRSNEYHSKTTSKHMGLMQCADFTQLSPDLFLAAVAEACRLTGFKA